MLKQTKQQIILSASFASLLAASGCSWFSANDGRESIDDSYMRSQLNKTLQLPADNQEIKQEDQYLVPEGAVIVNRDAKGKLLGLEPPQLLLTSGDGVREDQDAKHPTVWLRGEASRFAEYLQGFTSANEIPVATSDAKGLTTDWLSDENEGIGEGLGSYNIDGQRHKFSLMLVAESAHEFDVQAIHSASEQEIDGSWQAIETSDRVAKQFLNQFIGFYDGVRSKEARAKILAEGSIETRLGTDAAGNMALVTERDIQSVWQQTDSVLQYLNLSITDKDQSTGTYYFTVAEKSGFWGSIFSKNEDPKVEMEPGDYKLELRVLTAGTSLTFRDQAGELLAPNLVGKIYPEFSAAYRSREIRK